MSKKIKVECGTPFITGKRKSKVAEMMPKVMNIINEGKANGETGRAPVTRMDIAKATGLSVNSVSKAIRLLRQHEAAPIMPTKKGFVPASAATVKDDVHLMRITNSRISSLFLVVSNCKEDILKRWPGAKRRQILGAMSPVVKAAEIGMNSMKLLEGKL